MPVKNTTPQKNSLLLNVLGLGLLTGTLDALAALIWNLILNYKNQAVDYKLGMEIIFRFIASGAFGGQAAFAGGKEMIIAGAVFHYIIAFVFSAVFYLAYPFCNKYLNSKYLVAVAYGLTAWIIMNLMVIPVSKIGFHPIKLQVILIGILILIICIGLPIALITNKQLKTGRFSGLK
ncbi:hypothetical protein SAMN05216464_102660 [Mucilaginibacter pineti]|uniref:DUF1440 domain-containing protein n=1 Tax=Mucilaginibacter pineti TaxID=1391627 RepID=A0A1G6XTK2_9SPHI|nr:hypothetical protein [Mucilaginibacter pineti]SDD81508.1 hypothetical protein SAMN05216464_102660 [Mucilaginibacter pineti]